MLCLSILKGEGCEDDINERAKAGMNHGVVKLGALEDDDRLAYWLTIVLGVSLAWKGTSSSSAMMVSLVVFPSTRAL